MSILEKPFWQESKKEKKFPKLKEDIEIDVAIVGGGLCGIATAYLLSFENLNVAVFEAKDQLASDTTMYTTAFITQVLDTSLNELKRLFGEKNARLAWESGHEAIDLIDDIVKREKIVCDFERVSFYTYANKPEQFKELEKEHHLSRKLGFKCTLHKTAHNLGFKNFGAWEVKDQAKFNPIKFADQLAEIAAENGVRFFTNTEIADFKERKGKIILQTKKNEITTKKIISATYKPLKVMKTFAKKGMYQSYVLKAQLPKNKIKEATYVDLTNPYHYFRIDRGIKHDHIIIGGEDHRQDIPVRQSRHFKNLEKYLKEVVSKDCKITNKWTGPILEPSDGLALIGETKKNQYVATGFSGNGMTYSFIAAMIFHDLIMKDKNPWTKLYDPTRRLTAKRFAIKGRDYVVENIRSIL